MIAPTVGRVVWFHPKDQLAFSDQPLAAIVTYVWGPRMVNLVVFDSNGKHHNRTSVDLVQEGDTTPDYSYCEWMPYQKGQAAKTEALEAWVPQPRCPRCFGPLPCPKHGMPT